ncbi:DUF2780 domain-containing protein [Kiritimatiellaeota bacterium B1221]|nr:DUF2780 domain-containing protein [Kiritimatiellaeota bacterium B1221]
MLDNPLLKDLINKENLSEGQASGALGLVLAQLRKYLQADQFARLQKFIPGCDELIANAPDIKSGLLGGLAGNLGGGKAKALLDLSKGLSGLGISADKQKGIANTLKESVEKHYPDLASLIDLG